MMTFTDRQPAVGKENRYKLTKSDGSFEYVKLERADEANPVGTPLNKTTFENMQTELMPIFGTYTGNGEAEGNVIVLGFQPKALLVFSDYYMGFISSNYNSGAGIIYIEGLTIDENIPLKIQSNGFVPKTTSSSRTYGINSNGKKYYYIAFR